MKVKCLLTVVCLALVLALALPSVQAASAQATFTDCAAELTLLGYEEGTVSFHGPNMHIRGRVVWFEQVSDNPLCAGLLTVVVNYNLDADGAGPKWGTFSWEAAANATTTGGFEGAFTGWSEEYTWSSSVHAVGRGYGDLDGLQIREFIDFPTILHGFATVTVLDPHGD
jgi:hypothetical protein